MGLPFTFIVDTSAEVFIKNCFFPQNSMPLIIKIKDVGICLLNYTAILIVYNGNIDR